MSQKRAPKGGQTGINGEFYEGGKFLPSTQRAKTHKLSATPTRKQEIEPYVWAVPPEGKRSIYEQYHSLWEWESTGTFQKRTYRVQVIRTPAVWEYYGAEFMGKASEAAERWNNGERWQ